MKSVSIVIPTSNRLTELQQTLLALENQTIQASQVIIIDDNSPQSMFWRMQEVIEKLKLPVTCLSNAPQKGPAAARNKGILHAEGEFILFINDDTSPAQTTFLEQHLSFAMSHPNCCILGKLAWAPETPNRILLGKWTNRLSLDVGYDAIKKGEQLSFHKFCTANVLVPRQFLQNCLFDEYFPFAAYEDIELGYRLASQGRTLLYNPDACVYHAHEYTSEMLVDRQTKTGHSLAYFLHIHPELAHEHSPKISYPMTILLNLFVKTPIFSLYSNDFQLFLLQLTKKYNAFWKTYRKYSRTRRERI